MARCPRVAAIHDMSGLGRCSLTVVLPVLAVMGARVSPLQTAWLSAHTGYPASDKSVFTDMTNQMEATAAHWKELGVTFDAIYSGFLGSARQIDVLGRFLADFGGSGCLVMVDPVMGDWGRPYRTYTPDLCRRMTDLAAHADVITPNLTEAAILLREDYDPAPDGDKTAQWLERLSLDGKRSVVLTGVSGGEGTVGACCFDHGDGSTALHLTRAVDGQFAGTGDLFSSVVLGDLLRGATLSQGVKRAVDFVALCAGRSADAGLPTVEGGWFEGVLDQL